MTKKPNALRGLRSPSPVPQSFVTRVMMNTVVDMSFTVIEESNEYYIVEAEGQTIRALRKDECTIKVVGHAPIR